MSRPKTATIAKTDITVGQETVPVLVLDEDEFARALGGKAQVEALAGTTKILDDGNTGSLKQKMVEQLPRVLAKKLEGMLPDNFVVSSIEMKIGVDAKLFGAGVSGEATVTFEPKK